MLRLRGRNLGHRGCWSRSFLLSGSLLGGGPLRLFRSGLLCGSLLGGCLLGVDRLSLARGILPLQRFGCCGIRPELQRRTLDDRQFLAERRDSAGDEARPQNCASHNGEGLVVGLHGVLLSQGADHVHPLRFP